MSRVETFQLIRYCNSLKQQGYEEIKDIQIVQAGLYIYGLIPAVKASTRREVGLDS